MLLNKISMLNFVPKKFRIGPERNRVGRCIRKSCLFFWHTYMYDYHGSMYQSEEI